MYFLLIQYVARFNSSSNELILFSLVHMQISSLFEALKTCNLMFISSTNYIVFKHVLVR